MSSSRHHSIHVSTLVVLIASLALAPAALPGRGLAIARADAATPTRLGDRGLRAGMRGHDVKALQRLLNRAGFRTPLSGTFAAPTTRSVSAFQRAAGLEPSGVAGRKTVRRLRGAAASGGAAPIAPAAESSALQPPAPGQIATIGDDGLATAPADAPREVLDMIAAGNEIATTPYRYGGGHKSFDDDAYDCSGSVGYVLHAAGLLDHTVTSGELETWGLAGPGGWLSVYANEDHTFLVVAGIRFDTSGQKRTGSRWQPMNRTTEGFVVRRADGL